MTRHASESDFAELALAVYLEELVRGKRVLYVGDPESGALERLARAARSIDLVTPRARARGTRRGGRVQPRRWPGPDETGRWDVVIAPDLGAAGLADESKIGEASRWLASSGVLVAGTSDPSVAAGLSYEELFDLVDASFESVRMIGQAPFNGYSVVDFAPPGELEVTFDGSLLEGSGERAQRYYALCAERDVVLDAYAVVQVPGAVSSGAVSSGAVSSGAAQRRDPRALREQQDALDAASVHAEEMERELEGVRADLVRSQKELEQATARESAAQAERERLVDAQKALEAQIAALRTEESFDAEYAQLEASLAERARELTELRAEADRRATIVRDLVEELRAQRTAEARPGSQRPPPPDGLEPLSRAMHAQLDEAVQRAVAAEAERAQLAFKLDEVRGELAIAESRSREELEELRRLEAALRGTVRGLNARLAEVIELHQLTQARLALAEDDRNAAEARNRRLVRELAEVREQVELGIATKAVETSAERELGEVGRLVAENAELVARQKQALIEAEKAREAFELIEQRVEGMRRGYETRIAELCTELEVLGADAERALLTTGELRAKLEAKDRTEAALRGELAGVHLRLADREAAVAELKKKSGDAVTGEVDALRSELASAREGTERLARDAAARAKAEAESEIARAREDADKARAALAKATEDAARSNGAAEAELARAKDGIETLRAQLARASEDASHANGEAEAELARARETIAQLRAELEQSDRTADTSGVVAARDALAARLQRELADAHERRRGLERRLDDCGAKLIALREELEAARAVSEVRSHEEQREVGELKERADRAERERLAALEGLEEARAILEKLALDVGPSSGPAGESDAAAVRQLRERVARLDAEAADREVLLRSLTAQLQERDDRLRALERAPSAGENADARALHEKLLEMEERVERLTEELEHERDARRRAEGRAPS